MCSVRAVNAELNEQVVGADGGQIMPSAVKGKMNRCDSAHEESLRHDNDDGVGIGGIG